MAGWKTFAGGWVVEAIVGAFLTYCPVGLLGMQPTSKRIITRERKHVRTNANAANTKGRQRKKLEANNLPSDEYITNDYLIFSSSHRGLRQRSSSPPLRGRAPGQHTTAHKVVGFFCATLIAIAWRFLLTRAFYDGPRGRERED